MQINDIRSSFLDYFKSNEHTVVHSSPLVPNNDPTLMFTNSGMVQFKNVFTGLENREYQRATTSQKCLRAGGKHNDLENVGYTLRHHTFFEMLGNFSFGDYFKDEAIEYAWNYITGELGINKDKLYVTIYHDDEQAYFAWKKITNFTDDKIIRISTNDNFWSMGDTGPCGPCSEIFYDHGENYQGKPPSEADETQDRFVEIWNLVFMQYEQVDEKTRLNLPKPSIDTGMGIERIAAVMQGTNDNYEIDLFKKLIDHSIDITKKNEKELISSHRVIADHLRSSSFLIADGILPSNEGRGYVLRRIMRRAMRHIQLLDYSDTMLSDLFTTLSNEMSSAYPELQRAENLIKETLKYEEIKFKDLLLRGMKQLEEELKPHQGSQTFPGSKAFKLYDTYGFPLDLTQDILRSKNIEVDIKGFNQSLEDQKNRARSSWSGSGDKSTEKIWFNLSNKINKTEFIGYENNISQAEVLSIISDSVEVDQISKNQQGRIILNQSVFYAESGGQIGDVGNIRCGESNFKVTDTQKKENLIIHYGMVSDGVFKIADVVELEIDVNRRSSCRSYHSATHILHQALRDTLGDHVTQKGSLVSYDRLRFDFSHHKGLSEDEIKNIEGIVNNIINSNLNVETKIMKSEDAINLGALALFGEKYDDEVRVLSIGDNNSASYSLELCGGTHVEKTSEIGNFKIISESSAASGIRRIEALRGNDLISYNETKSKQIENDLEKNKIIEDAKKINLEIIKKLSQNIQERIKYGETLIVETCNNLKPKDLRSIVDQCKSQFLNDGVIVVGVINDEKISFLVGVTNKLSNNLSASEIALYAAKITNGRGGGGRKDFAQSGGTYSEEINIKETLQKFLKENVSS
ncbi:MAG: alanine--tRNA ligase [Pelagibacterales bacterium]|nr:alanine--tRNA ligase [Pelagibacterales bacterium]